MQGETIRRVLRAFVAVGILAGAVGVLAQSQPPSAAPSREAADATAAAERSAEAADAASDDDAAPDAPAAPAAAAAESGKSGPAPRAPAAARGSPQHFEPTEKVRPDFDVAFPVDI